MHKQALYIIASLAFVLQTSFSRASLEEQEAVYQKVCAHELIDCDGARFTSETGQSRTLSRVESIVQKLTAFNDGASQIEAPLDPSQVKPVFSEGSLITEHHLYWKGINPVDLLEQPTINEDLNIEARISSMTQQPSGAIN